MLNMLHTAKQTKQRTENIYRDVWSKFASQYNKNMLIFTDCLQRQSVVTLRRNVYWFAVLRPSQPVKTPSSRSVNLLTLPWVFIDFLSGQLELSAYAFATNTTALLESSEREEWFQNSS